MDEEQLLALYSRLSLLNGWDETSGPINFNTNDESENFGQDFEGFKNLMQTGESEQAQFAIKNVYNMVSQPYQMAGNTINPAYTGSYDEFISDVKKKDESSQATMATTPSAPSQVDGGTSLGFQPGLLQKSLFDRTQAMIGMDYDQTQRMSGFLFPKPFSLDSSIRAQGSTTREVTASDIENTEKNVAAYFDIYRSLQGNIPDEDDSEYSELMKGFATLERRSDQLKYMASADLNLPVNTVVNYDSFTELQQGGIGVPSVEVKDEGYLTEREASLGVDLGLLSVTPKEQQMFEDYISNELGGADSGYIPKAVSSEGIDPDTPLAIRRQKRAGYDVIRFTSFKNRDGKKEYTFYKGAEPMKAI